MVGMLRISALRGLGLAPEDGTSCDPYVSVKFGDKEFRTERIPKNHETPVWKDIESMKCDWDGQSPLPKLEFTVWDHDYLSSDDFIGFSTCQLHREDIGKECRVALGVRTEADKSLLEKFGSLGALFFRIDYSGPELPTPSNSRSTASVKPPASSTQPRGPVLFRVTKVRAEALAPVDGESCDPYGTVRLGNSSLTLDKISSNRNPIWDCLPVQELRWDGVSSMPVMELELHDSNRVFSDEFLGYAKVQLEPSMIGRETKVELKPSGDRGKNLLDKFHTLGFACITLEAVREVVSSEVAAEQVLPPLPDPPKGGVSLRIRGAKRLPARNTSGESLECDSSVVVCLSSADGLTRKVGETAVSRGTCSPKWESVFTFPFGAHSAIQFAVVDHEAGGTDDFLGLATLRISELPPTGTRELTLQPRQAQPADVAFLRSIGRSDFGVLQVEWKHSVPQQSGSSRAISHSAHRAGDTSAAHDDIIDVVVLCATNVAHPRDFYVVVESGGQRFASEVVGAPVEAPMAVVNFQCQLALPRHRSTPAPISIKLVSAQSHEVIGLGNLKVTNDNRGRQMTHAVSIIPTAMRSRADAMPVAELTVVSMVHLPKPISADALKDAVLRLCVISAQVNPTERVDQAPPNTYVTVNVIGDEGDAEFRSATVPHTFAPQWYFTLPNLDLNDTNQIIEITVWDEDTLGFDDFLGVVRVAVRDFTRGVNAVELALEDRPDAAGRRSSASDLGRILLEWVVEPRPRPVMVTAPKILEVTILDAKDLPATGSSMAVVHISCDDQPNAQLTTGVAPKAGASWNESIQMKLDGAHNTLRLSVWDDASRTANFLGEYICSLATLGELDEMKVIEANLRPRRDPQLNSHDVMLMNQSSKGLGSIRFALKLFSLREYEARTREKLRAEGHAFTFVMQVSDTAEIGRRGNYYVRVTAAGEDRVSQVECSAHPRFRKRFSFELHYETELVSVALVERSDLGDVTVGEVAFPVSSPDRVGTEPITTWVDLKSSGGAAASSRDADFAPIKLLLRWRTFREGHRSALVSNRSPDRTRRGEDESFSIDIQPGTVAQLTSGSTPPARRSASTAPAVPRYFINVYSPDHGAVVGFSPAAVDTAVVGDVLAYALREFKVRAAVPHTVVFAGGALPTSSRLRDLVPCGETVFLIPSPPSPMRASAASGPSSSPPGSLRGRHPDSVHMDSQSQQSYVHPSPNVTQTVLDRLDSYGHDAAVATAVLTVPTHASSLGVSHVVDIFQAHRVVGFGRPIAPNATEFFIQGAPQMLASVLRVVVHDTPSSIVEEVKGYIPMLTAGFRMTTSLHDGVNMFTACSTPYGTSGDVSGGQAWFYKATEETSLPGVRYIDERG